MLKLLKINKLDICMLVEFTVNNFKSIKDTVKFSMLTSSKDEGNCFEKESTIYLKVPFYMVLMRVVKVIF